MHKPAPINSLGFIGSGRVASSLAPAFVASGIDVRHIISRNTSTGPRLAEQSKAHFSSDLQDLDADALILAVPDDAIAAVSASIRTLYPDLLLIHLSGGTPIAALGEGPAAVMWPIQTFAQGRATSFSDLPFCVSAVDPAQAIRVASLASKLSSVVKVVSEEERQKLHLGAVVVSNFPNHLYALADQFLSTAGLSLDLLRPLIAESSDLPKGVAPASLQTGPAVRGDEQVVSRQLDQLKEFPVLELFYGTFSRSIMDFKPNQKKDTEGE